MLTCSRRLSELARYCHRGISTTAIKYSTEKKWRQQNGLPENHNSFGPLTNLPDYTFMDGRPTPLGANLKKRLNKQKHMTIKMVEMCKELDAAKQRPILAEQERVKREKAMKEQQYKPKGHLLLNKKSSV